MGKINLLIANSDNSFTSDEIATIINASQKAEDFINKHFAFDYDVDIVVTSPSYLMKTIPEDGITGRTYNSQLIMLVINKKEMKVTEDTIFETICHEMSHSLRWQKVPEYSETLFQGMILEGLAIVLEEEAMKEMNSQDLQFFLKTIQGTDETEYKTMISELEKFFEDKDYDYETLFFTGNDVLPRWAGYRLGYYYVKKYMNMTRRSIEEATLDSYVLFTKWYNSIYGTR